MIRLSLLNFVNKVRTKSYYSLVPRSQQQLCTEILHSAQFRACISRVFCDFRYAHSQKTPRVGWSVNSNTNNSYTFLLYASHNKSALFGCLTNHFNYAIKMIIHSFEYFYSYTMCSFQGTFFLILTV